MHAALGGDGVEIQTEEGLRTGGFLEEAAQWRLQRIRGLEGQGLEGCPRGQAWGPGWAGGSVSRGLRSRGWGLRPSPRLQVGALPRARTVVLAVRVMASAGVLGVLLT